MPEAPSLKDFSSEPYFPDLMDDSLAVEIHEAEVSEVEVIDGQESDAGHLLHGSNTEEEMV